MRRRLFTFCSAVSLLLCVAVCVLWVRSYWVVDKVLVALEGSDIYAVSANGEFRLEHARAIVPRRKSSEPILSHDTEAAKGSGAFPERVPGSTLRFRVGGFALVTGERWGDDHVAAFAPAWACAATTLVLPICFARRRPTRTGFCPACGYDVRATPDRCPECGAKPAPAGATA